MKKSTTTRFSSAIGDVWIMMTLKVKYCHKVFDKKEIREYTGMILEQALKMYGIQYRSIGFDSDHVHINLNMGIYGKPDIAKKLKGFTASKILKEFWWLKSRFFRGHGFWNPATDGRSGDMNFYEHYVANQKYGCANQTKLAAFV